MKKVAKLSFIIALIGICIALIVFSELNKWIAVGSLAGTFLGCVLSFLTPSIEDLFDNTLWKSNRRKLERAKIINKNTIVRISFAYLFRIKIGNKYLLVKNNRNTGKFQPVGGVYKFKEEEKMYLKNEFHVCDDKYIPIDESSRNDYRLLMENKYLNKFIKRFNKNACRERIDDLSREFKEELINTRVLSWHEIKYRVCGRHFSEFKFGDFFQKYELLLADIVEIILTKSQEDDLLELLKNKSSYYKFVTENEIKTLGTHSDKQQLEEKIADHSIKILQTTESKLLKLTESGQVFNIKLD